MTNVPYYVEKAGRVIKPGTGGRHRKVVEPTLAGLVLRQLLAQARGARR